MEQRAKLLAGKTALVTGAARGLGRAIAFRLAAEGAVGLALDLPSADWADGPPEGWLRIAADVTREAELQAAVRAAVERFGRLDITVANAGVVPPWSETEQIDLALWDAVFAVNVRGVVATIKAAVPAMKDKGGSIVLTGSMNSWRGHPRQCLYVAAKHAVLGIARATALDLGRYGIRVNALAPGAVATEALLERVDRRAAAGGLSRPEALSRFAMETALGRMTTDADVANAALFLASDLSAGMTGLLLPVDGGIS